MYPLHDGLSSELAACVDKIKPRQRRTVRASDGMTIFVR
jgi:hypothetical protein